ncbi:hypothetical protein Tsubulata_042389 [Turnera subulata]|uniref:RPN1 N-terminal domain-containing protein n=1 Tax=Turnera subulata TaxID=218843 RepID=A0A9Q0JF30_9ROSI|nr:hypothetical protein Tsubulata_042389 [Turnera subulata]
MEGPSVSVADDEMGGDKGRTKVFDFFAYCRYAKKQNDEYRAQEAPKAATEDGKDKLFELLFQVRPEDYDKLSSLLRLYGGQVLQQNFDAIRDLRREIRALTSSINWKPKPLEFVRPYYEDFEACYKSMDASHSRSRKYLADILSVLAQTTPSAGCASLKYRLLGSGAPLRSWGPGYIMRLRLQIKPVVQRLERNKLPTRLVLDVSRDILNYLGGLSDERDKERVFILKYRSWKGCGSDCKDDCGSDCERDCLSNYKSECGSGDSVGKAQLRKQVEIYKQVEKVERFDADLITVDGLCAFPTYGPGFRFNSATHGTKERYIHFNELALKLARDSCEYYSCTKGVDHQLVFQRLIKAIVFPLQRFYITLVATHMGNQKIVRAEVTYGWFYMRENGVEFTIHEPQPFDQAERTIGPANCISLKNPFAVYQWKNNALYPTKDLLRAYATHYGIWPCSLDKFLQFLLDFSPVFLGEMQVALLRSIEEDTEGFARSLIAALREI